LFIVEDTGIGIRSEDVAKLFNLFGKLKDAEDINKEGVGLGLMICKNITEAMGGRINVESILGKGSCFSFKIVS
jgi:signal transduction histidine kinase